MEEIIVKVDGKEYKVLVEETKEGRILVHCGSDIYEVETKSDADRIFSENLVSKKIIEEGKTSVTSPLPGIITEVKVKNGGKVEKGEILLKLMAMKMENEVIAPKSGVVVNLAIKKDDKVGRGDLLVVIES